MVYKSLVLRSNLGTNYTSQISLMKEAIEVQRSKPCAILLLMGFNLLLWSIGKEIILLEITIQV